jgi:hydroxymethylbilane synthase
LLERRPDLTIVELRGNMATRLARAGRDGVDAVVAAGAALERLGIANQAAERLDPTWFVPQVGQGALALEASELDVDTLEALRVINNHEWFTCVRAERAFLSELGVGCSVPVGAHATLQNSLIALSGVMASADGSTVLRATVHGDNAEALGITLAKTLRDEMGGAELSGWR